MFPVASHSKVCILYVLHTDPLHRIYNICHMPDAPISVYHPVGRPVSHDISHNSDYTTAHVQHFSDHIWCKALLLCVDNIQTFCGYCLVLFSFTDFPLPLSGDICRSHAQGIPNTSFDSAQQHVFDIPDKFLDLARKACPLS